MGFLTQCTSVNYRGGSVQRGWDSSVARREPEWLAKDSDNTLKPYHASVNNNMPRPCGTIALRQFELEMLADRLGIDAAFFAPVKRFGFA